MMSMFWYTASAVPRYQLVSEMRWLAGRISKLSFAPGERSSSPSEMPDQAVGLVLGCTAMRRIPGVHGVGEGKIDDARFAAEIDRRLGAPSVSSRSRLPRPPAERRRAHGVKAARLQ
jgi:hypothetical protein